LISRFTFIKEEGNILVGKRKVNWEALQSKNIECIKGDINKVLHPSMPNSPEQGKAWHNFVKIAKRVSTNATDKNLTADYQISHKGLPIDFTLILDRMAELQAQTSSVCCVYTNVLLKKFFRWPAHTLRNGGFSLR
jgi:hypothetical protein